MQRTCLFLVLLCGSALCAADSPPEPRTVNVITYNVQFLPGIAGKWNEREEPEYRARRIAEEVSTFDLVGLQETFDRKHRRQILDGVRKAWGGRLNTVVSPKAGNHMTNGGCLILTRLPILESNSVIFEHYSSASDYGLRADGFAAKGVIHARIALNKAEQEGEENQGEEEDWESSAVIDVFVTHLEARDGDMRARQYEELASFIKEVSDPGIPLLLMGDLNTSGMPEYRDEPESRYSMLMGLLNDARPNGGVVDVWPLLKGDALGGTTDQVSEEVGKRIDYIIVANPEPPEPQLKPTAVRVNTYQDPEVVALSDHNAVEAECEWTWQRPK